jgi:hypothetical protein
MPGVRKMQIDRGGVLLAGTVMLALACGVEPVGDVDDSGAATTDVGSGSSESGEGETEAQETEDTEGSEFERWELRAGGFQPPNAETWYSCYSFQIEVEQLHHIVGFEAKVTSPLVHHYVLSLSDEPVDLNPAESCVTWPRGIVWSWAPGMEPLNLPEEAGLLVGDAPGGVVTFVMQVHYNNPLREVFTDDDGIDVLVTKDLRQHEAGIFTVGDIYNYVIPPGEPAYEHVSRCESDRTSSLLDHEIHVFAAFLHAHDIGRAISSEVFRDGSLVGPIAVDDPFDFNSQQFWPASIDIRPGDVIETRCVYDSSERTSTTPGGIATEHEMCLNIMMYYPKVAGEKCGSI